MQLTVLTDNCAGAGFLAEHGLSFLVESKGQKVLFDTGHTDVFLKNATTLEIDRTHPAAFKEKFSGNDDNYIGLDLTKDELEDKYNLVATKESYKISDNMFFLGEIPRLTEFESKTTPFVDKEHKPDYMPDDSAICIVENDEIIVISGCAHSGICNTILHAQKVTGISKMYFPRIVPGLMHLLLSGRNSIFRK